MGRDRANVGAIGVDISSEIEIENGDNYYWPPASSNNYRCEMENRAARIA